MVLSQSKLFRLTMFILAAAFLAAGLIGGDLALIRIEGSTL
jgi:hypothetical protein